MEEFKEHFWKEFVKTGDPSMYMMFKSLEEKEKNKKEKNQEE